MPILIPERAFYTIYSTQFGLYVEVNCTQCNSSLVLEEGNKSTEDVWETRWCIDKPTCLCSFFVETTKDGLWSTDGFL